MDFLKRLNEEYRLFYIDPEEHSIEEIDIDQVLDQGAPQSDEPEQDDDQDVENGEDQIDFSQFEPEAIEPDENDNFEPDMDDDSPQLDNIDDELVNPETKGETHFDPNLSGLQFDPDDKDEADYDESEYHYVQDGPLSAKNNTHDEQDDNGFDASEDYSDVLDGMDIGSYLAKYAGVQSDEGGEDFEQSGEDFPQDDQDVQGEEGLEDLEGEEGEEQPEDLEGEEQSEEDPSFQGVIRPNPAGSVLVYKRQNSEGTFTELWIYNNGNNIKDTASIRRNILAGTDIDAVKSSSPDGTQTAETTSIGNVTFLKIEGMPS